MNKKQREIRFGAPKYGTPPKKGIGQDGFRQAREDHRSGSDAAGDASGGTGTTNTWGAE